jgi:hypothetical protein
MGWLELLAWPTAPSPTTPPPPRLGGCRLHHHRHPLSLPPSSLIGGPPRLASGGAASWRQGHPRPPGSGPRADRSSAEPKMSSSARATQPRRSGSTDPVGHSLLHLYRYELVQCACRWMKASREREVAGFMATVAPCGAVGTRRGESKKRTRIPLLGCSAVCAFGRGCSWSSSSARGPPRSSWLCGWQDPGGSRVWPRSRVRCWRGLLALGPRRATLPTTNSGAYGG